MPLNLHAGLDNRFLVRTEAGAQELRERALGLTQKIRTLLVLADGKRTVGEVRRLMGTSGVETEKLQQLLDMGLLEISRTPALSGPGFLHSTAPISISLASKPLIDPSPAAAATPTFSAPQQQNPPAVLPSPPAVQAMPLPAPARTPTAPTYVKAEPAIEPAVLAVRSHLAQALPALMPAQSATLMFRLGSCTTRQHIETLLQEMEGKFAQSTRTHEVADALRHARALLAAA